MPSFWATSRHVQIPLPIAASRATTAAMDGYDFTLAGAALTALPSGALHWPARDLLCVSDLHLGKAERRAGAARRPCRPTRRATR